MECHTFPLLRDNAREGSAGASIGTNARQQHAEFGRDARAGLLLQHALAQDAFQSHAILREAGAANIPRQTVRNPSFNDGFPIGHEAVIDPGRRREQGARRPFAPIFDGAEFDFDLAGIGHRCVRPVERTKRRRAAAPAGDYRHDGKRNDDPPRHHGAGRNTQIAAGSPELARTATNSRSRSGTKSDVRAPDAVGTRAIR